jgi:enoyl-CoA hydratase
LQEAWYDHSSQIDISIIFLTLHAQELACWADLRIADLSSTFGVFCRRFGVPLIDGGTIRLPRLIGLSRAMDMILTGRAVSAQEALSFGLVNKVVESEKLESETMALAELICSFPQGCLRADRFSTVFSPSAHDPLRVHLKAEFDRGSAVIESESVLGAAAFASGAGRHGKWASKL